MCGEKLGQGAEWFGNGLFYKGQVLTIKLEKQIAD
jgi:hypothetical protein